MAGNIKLLKHKMMIDQLTRLNKIDMLDKPGLNHYYELHLK